MTDAESTMSRSEQIRKMLAADPGDVFLNFALGMEYLKQGQPDEAVAQFARVNALDPDHTAAYVQRAGVLIDMGRRDEARAVLTEGIAAAGRAGDPHAAAKMRETLSLLD